MYFQSLKIHSGEVPREDLVHIHMRPVVFALGVRAVGEVTVRLWMSQLLRQASPSLQQLQANQWIAGSQILVLVTNCQMLRAEKEVEDISIRR